ncbi:MAG: glycoside hydrolase, partial [Anaerolineae bacterium]|nr:glycoside hydrolase [Anaerolineae bacterium]
VTALFFAAGRWGNGEGIFNYAEEAKAILNTMQVDMFDPETKQVVFVPGGVTGTFTDPSYHQPHYYELWARWTGNTFWAEAAAASRAFWKTTAHPETGLMPNYAKFTGEPQPWGDYGEVFYSDSWRNAMNVAVDYAWFEADPWQVEQSNRWLEFFYNLGIGRYHTKFMIDGTPVAPKHRSPGLIAMNATASLAATTEHRWEFVEEFWETPLPSGQWRYYDGLLYMLALLHLSGNFKVYEPV